VHVEDLKAMASTAQRVGKALVGGLGAAGVNLMLSSGRAAFQSVFHIHFHVIPRYPDDHIRLPWIPAAGDLKAIAAVGRSMRSALAQD
jgi:histidine triad (HIT) family protein